MLSRRYCILRNSRILALREIAAFSRRAITMTAVESFQGWLSSAHVGANVLCRATVASRDGRRVRLRITADHALLAEVDVDAAADPLPADLVHAFHTWETSEDARAIVETYARDHLFGAEFDATARKTRSLRVVLDRGPRYRDGTYRTLIRLMHGSKTVREFEFVDDAHIGKRTFIRPSC